MAERVELQPTGGGHRKPCAAWRPVERGVIERRSLRGDEAARHRCLAKRNTPGLKPAARRSSSASSASRCGLHFLRMAKLLLESRVFQLHLLTRGNVLHHGYKGSWLLPGTPDQRKGTIHPHQAAILVQVGLIPTF